MVLLRKFLVTVFYLFLLLLWTAIWYYDDLSENPGKTPDIYWFVPAALILFQMIAQRFVFWIIVWIFFDLLFILPVIAPLFRFAYDQTFIYNSIPAYLVGVAVFALFNLAFYFVNPQGIKSKQPVTISDTGRTKES
jgi:hypothetical protein